MWPFSHLYGHNLNLELSLLIRLSASEGNMRLGNQVCSLIRLGKGNQFSISLEKLQFFYFLFFRSLCEKCSVVSTPTQLQGKKVQTGRNIRTKKRQKVHNENQETEGSEKRKKGVLCTLRKCTTQFSDNAILNVPVLFRLSWSGTALLIIQKLYWYRYSVDPQ